MKQFICPLCGATESKSRFQAKDFDQSSEVYELLQCGNCGLAVTTPVPEMAKMNQYYPEAYYGSSQKKFHGVVEFLIVWASKLRAKRVLKEARKAERGDQTKKMLDIGCGRGNLLRFLKELGCECFGTERSNFPAETQPEGIKVLNCSVTEGGFEDEFFDAVIIWHVLEHFDDPFVTLDEVVRITRRGGTIAVAVPNFSSLQARWFQSDWFHLDLPRHLFHFDADNLCYLLKSKGYSITSVSTNSLEQNVFGFIQSFLNKFKFLGKPNEFYRLIQSRTGIKQNLKLMFWLFIAIPILPFALIEYLMSFILKRGASVMVYAHKA